MSGQMLALGPAASTLRWQPSPLFVLAGAMVILRAVYLPWINLFPEEAYYWNYSKHLDYGYLDHPPIVAWLIRLGTGLFGHGELSVRFFAVVCSFVTSFFAFRLAQLLYGRTAAGVTLLSVQLLPFFFLSGWVMTPDAPLNACWAGMLYYLARVFFAGSARAWWGVGVCLGLGLLSKYTIALLGPATLLFLALDAPSRPWFRRALPYAVVELAVVMFSPVIAWNFQHGWASFAFQSMDRLHECTSFSLQYLLGSIALLLTPLGVFLAGQPLFTRGGGPPVVPGAENAGRRQRLFARVFTLVPLAVFTFFSLKHRVKLNWTGPLWLAVLPLASARLAAAFAGTTPTPGTRLIRWGAWVTAALLLVLFAGSMQYLAFGLPGARYTSHMELLPVGWPEMARSLAEQVVRLRAAQPRRVLVVGLDRNFIASETAFYAPDPARAVRETTGRHLFGSVSLMYAYWFPAREQEDAMLLLVSFDKNDLDIARIHRRCRALDPVQTTCIQLRGYAIRPYYTQSVTTTATRAIAASVEQAHDF